MATGWRGGGVSPGRTIGWALAIILGSVATIAVSAAAAFLVAALGSMFR